MKVPLKTVVIVGGGSAGWMAAMALARLIGPALSITLVESDEIGIVGVGEATIPAIRHFNAAIRLDETAFVRQTYGSYKLGIEFVGWGAPDQRYLHAFGDIGATFQGIPYHHYWIKEGLERGQFRDLWAASLSAMAARSNRFAPEVKGPDPRLTGPAYAFHFDATAYARALRTQAEALGVRRIEGKVVSVDLDPDKGDVRAIRLDSGAEVAGELFLDCSGFRGLLIEGALKTGYENWQDWLPCDRALAVPCESVSPLTPYTRASARPAGWQWRIPLQHRIGNGHVYCSAMMSDDQAADLLLAHLDGPALADPRPIRFTTGRRKAFWNRNVVALGLASGFLEPLESTSIHLIQSGIVRLISLFPDAQIDPVLRDTYNRQMGEEFERVRDFIILHYWANGRDEPFWRDRRAMTLPETLQRKIDLFRETGRIIRENEELFTEVAWLQVLWGQGIRPEGFHPIARQLTSAQSSEFMDHVETLVRATAQCLPDHAAYIAAHVAAAAA